MRDNPIQDGTTSGTDRVREKHILEVSIFPICVASQNTSEIRLSILLLSQPQTWGCIEMRVVSYHRGTFLRISLISIYTCFVLYRMIGKHSFATMLSYYERYKVQWISNILKISVFHGANIYSYFSLVSYFLKNLFVTQHYKYLYKY